MNRGLPLLPQSQIDRPLLAQGFSQSKPNLCGVPGAENGHVGKGSKKGYVFEGVMCSPQACIGEASSNPHKKGWKIMVADVNLNLFKAAGGKERDDGIENRIQSREGQPRSHPDHVGLRHTTVVKTAGVTFFIGVEKPVPYIPRKQNDPALFCRKVGDLGGKGVSHVSSAPSGRLPALQGRESGNASCYHPP